MSLRCAPGARQAQHGSPILYTILAARCRHVPRRVRLLAKAGALSPSDPPCWGNMPSCWPTPTSSTRAQSILETARADGSINAQMRSWESEVHLLYGDLAKAIVVVEEVLPLNPEASVFVDRVQKLKALERPSEPLQAAALSLGAWLRTFCRSRSGSVRRWLSSTFLSCRLSDVVDSKHRQLLHYHHKARTGIEAQLEAVGNLR